MSRKKLHLVLGQLYCLNQLLSIIGCFHRALFLSLSLLIKNSVFHQFILKLIQMKYHKSLAVLSLILTPLASLRIDSFAQLLQVKWSYEHPDYFQQYFGIYGVKLNQLFYRLELEVQRPCRSKQRSNNLEQLGDDQACCQRRNIPKRL